MIFSLQALIVKLSNFTTIWWVKCQTQQPQKVKQHIKIGYFQYVENQFDIKLRFCNTDTSLPLTGFRQNPMHFLKKNPL